MATATTLSLAEYLETSYEPDCDFVDGILEDRHVGKKLHSKLQKSLILWLGAREAALGIVSYPEQRIRIHSTRVRVPDICAVKLPEPDEEVFTAPPFLCIEILSPDDTMQRMQARFDDYLSFGVPNIWAIDPASRRAWTITRLGHLECLNGILSTSDGSVQLPLADLFS